MKFWERAMLSKPSVFDRVANGVQKKINSYIPDKVRDAITTAIKTSLHLSTLVRTVLGLIQHFFIFVNPNQGNN